MSGVRAALPDRGAAIRRVFLGLLVANAAAVAVKVVARYRVPGVAILLTPAASRSSDPRSC